MKTLILLLLLASGSAYAQRATNGSVTGLEPEQFAHLAPPPVDQIAFQVHLAEAILRAVNSRRIQLGLIPLVPDPNLAQVASLSVVRMRGGAAIFPLSREAFPIGHYGKLAANMWSASGALDWRAETLANQAAAAWFERPNLVDRRYARAGVGTVMARNQVFAAIVFAEPGNTAVPAAAQSYRTAAQPDHHSAVRALPDELLNSLNAERTSQGLPALYADETLSAMAQDHSDAMVGQGFLGPSGPNGVSVLDRVLQTEPGRTVRMTAGFWRGSPEQPLAARVLDSWRRGDRGRNNIHDPRFVRAGIGASSQGYEVSVTVIYSEPSQFR